MTTLKALSVRQPWALAICHGKDTENRTRPTRHRGPIAIHAPKAWDDVGRFTLLWIADMIGLTPYQAAERDHRGAVLAVAEIVGCHRHRDSTHPCHADGAPICSPWAARGYWHWQLANVRPLQHPVPARGAAGLWPLPPDVTAAVLAQTENAQSPLPQ
ncbi:hypothetical protein Acsp04_44200 [Actinomadura sp. NBRC 104425]|uniref:hypothetical protein n=1 Tax=Actinomadura sp. NBRC 104425 TaxID=3032204 RepID=UPI0024A5A9AA|nr:hypothetical protein [Actinomadura sp. NBRC 104425]GLZ14185.1 hypothetical protein Acsp04_44200 [Actinomadura sp. NBRC 104425]